MPEKIIVYGHQTCPGVPPVLGMLKQTKADYEYINIRQNPEAASRVREINNGYESVPTLIFPDGSTLTEPSPGELQHKLNSAGYSVPFQALLIAHAPRLLLFAVILYGVLRFMGVI